MKLDPFFSPYAKIFLTWIKDVNIALWEAKAETEQENPEACYLLGFSPWLAQLALFIQPWTTYLGAVLPTVGRIPEHQSLVKKKIPPQNCLLANLVESIFFK